jgi:hypothetical protein
MVQVCSASAYGEAQAAVPGFPNVSRTERDQEQLVIRILRIFATNAGAYWSHDLIEAAF